MLDESVNVNVDGRLRNSAKALQWRQNSALALLGMTTVSSLLSGTANPRFDQTNRLFGETILFIVFFGLTTGSGPGHASAVGGLALHARQETRWGSCP